MKIKILFFSFFAHYHELRAYYDHLYRWFIRPFEDKVEFKFLADEEDYNKNLLTHEIDVLNPLLLSNENLKYIFPDTKQTFADMYQKVYNIGINPDEKERISEVLKPILKDWQPNIVMSMGFTNPKPIFEHIYPKALYLLSENAIFNRSPFNHSFNYDLYRIAPDNFMSHFAKDIKKIKLTFRQNLEVERFKRDFKKIIDKHSLINKEMQKYKKKYKKLVLLPLCGTANNIQYQNCPFEEDKDIVEYVMQNVPKDIGVVTTRHPGYHSFTNKELRHLLKKYKNFIFLQKTNNTGLISNSISYYKHIDGIININSKVGIMANLIYDKPMISITTQYNDLFKDGDDIKNIENALNTKNNKNNILYWYLTHYTIYETAIQRPNFLYNIIKNMLEKHRANKITCNFYEKNYTMEEVSKCVLKPIERYYQQQSKNNLPESYLGKIIRLIKKLTRYYSAVKA